MKCNQKVKYIFIVFFSIILSMTLHVMASNYSTTPKVANWSFFVEFLGLSLTLILWYLIAFGSIAFIFYRFEDRLPGVGSIKGLRYGISISILWLGGMIEGVSLSGNLLINEFFTGICDAIPILLMGLLLGKFTTKENNIENTVSSNRRFLSIFIFSTVFLVGRYLCYFTNIIKSGYQSSPYFTFIWTLLMGACIGVTYLLLGKVTKSSSAFLSATKFGIIIFGVNWTVFIIFIPFIFKGTLIGSIIRIVSDILLVILSCYISEFLDKFIVKKD